jgi:hypothetical protein
VYLQFCRDRRRRKIAYRQTPLQVTVVRIGIARYTGVFFIKNPDDIARTTAATLFYP